MTTPTTPAGWYADPLGRHQMRYFDGTQWTEHVSSNGRTAVDPPVGQGHVPTVQRAPEKVQRDVQRAGQAGVAAWQPGSGSIFTEPVLVVNQKAKLIEINNEYAIYDQNANTLTARGNAQLKEPNGNIVRGAYDGAEFLSTHEYKNVIRWLERMDKRPGVQRGQLVNSSKEGALAERHDASDFDKLDLTQGATI